jgi:hypothetical protein
VEQHEGDAAAYDWAQHASAEVVAMVRHEIAEEPTPRALRRALYRAQLASADELTAIVAERCASREYANAFGRTLLRSWVEGRD